MKRALNLCLIVVLQFCFTINAFAESKDIFFSQLSSKEGLSRSTVISIAQDKNNIMWFATFDGLNRYDGYSIKVYRNEIGNENSLMHDVLRTLYIDSDSIMWIGSRAGLSEYVYDKDNFNNYQCVINNDQTVQVNSIINYDDSHLLLGTESGLWFFDKNSKSFVDFQQLTSFKKSVQSLAKHGNNILIGSVDGLYIYNITRQYITTFNKVFDGVTIQAILPQSESRIWIGTEGAGLYLLNMTTGELQNYRHNPLRPNSLSSNYIRSLSFDSQFHLWVGTFNALSVKHNGDDSFVNYYHNPMQQGSISQNSIRSIYMDTQGGMWLGSYYGGINYYHPLRNKFGHLQQNPYTRSLNDRVMLYG